MITTFLVNFGYTIYEGSSLYDAMDKAEASGFEATVHNGTDVLHYSPISGWRFA